MKALQANNMEAYYVKTAAEVAPLVRQLAPAGSTVAAGGSLTLAQCGVMELLAGGGALGLREHGRPSGENLVRGGHPGPAVEKVLLLLRGRGGLLAHQWAVVHRNVNVRRLCPPSGGPGCGLGHPDHRALRRVLGLVLIPGGG